MIREISGEFPKRFKSKIAYEDSQGLPHHCHDHSLFTHHTLFKIYRLNKPPGQYFRFVWEKDMTFKIPLVTVSVSVISNYVALRMVLVCKSPSSTYCKIVHSILHNVSVQTQTVCHSCNFYRSPLLSLWYRKVTSIDCSCHHS